ncbi:transposable element Tcb2 transposase [Trichonephila clavipes]|nr:transposable element Tcb2 transposase [Trichonephila clavipes]
MPVVNHFEERPKKHASKLLAGRRAVLLAMLIVRSVPLEIVGSSGHEKVPTRGKPGVERQGRPRGEGSKDLAASTCGPHSDSFNDTSRLVPRQINVECHRLAKVVFSDESRFVLGTDDNRVRVWRRPGPSLNGLPGAIFQQDIARPHTARVAQDFLRHFQTLPWPTRSPDLSHEDHVWDQLKRLYPRVTLYMI